MKNSIILREERNQGDYRHLSAEIKDNGDLVFEGQDSGIGVKEVFGCLEYEWCWTVKATDIELFQAAVGEQGNILDLLAKHFSNDKAAGLYDFMKANNIPFEAWSHQDD